MADSFEALVGALGESVGVPLQVAGDGIAEVAVGERMVCLKAAGQGVRLFTTVETTTAGEEACLTPEALGRALDFNLFAERTAGFVIGRFAQTLLLSGELPLAQTDAERLAEQLLLLARVADEAEAEIFGTGRASSSPEAPAEVPSPAWSGAIRV